MKFSVVASLFVALLVGMGLVCLLDLAVPASAGNFTRQNASIAPPIATMDETLYDALIREVQPGSNSTNVTTVVNIVPDVPSILGISLRVFEDTWGSIALVVVFAIPFIMAWIMGGNVTLPSVMGIITGGFILWRLPEQYQLLAIGFIGLSVIAIIYSLLKEPK